MSCMVDLQTLAMIVGAPMIADNSQVELVEDTMLVDLEDDNHDLAERSGAHMSTESLY